MEQITEDRCELHAVRIRRGQTAAALAVPSECAEAVTNLLRRCDVCEISLPTDGPGRQEALRPEPVPGMQVVYDDAHIVVVDKPVGVAAHPSPGWSGPTVIGGLAAAGYRIATSGAAERQGKER